MTVIDSDVLIAHLRGRPAARGWLEGARRAGLVSVSAVSVAEVVGGVRAPDKDEVRRLLRSPDCVPVTRDIAEGGWRSSRSAGGGGRHCSTAAAPARPRRRVVPVPKR